MSVIETAVQWAISIANDNSHGYSQAVRWGPSYDCSSLVISAFKQAGLNLQSTYTGNMRADFLAHGFKAYSPSEPLKRGDVLLNEASHTALYIGNGQIVHARSSEGTSDTADNSGNEIRVQSYYNGNWDVVLRYEGAESAATPAATVTPVSTKQYLPNGASGKGIAALQGLLIYLGYDIGYFGRKHDGIDGDAGTGSSYTNRAVRQAVSDKKLTESEITTLLNLNGKE